MEHSKTSNTNKFSHWLRNSISARMIIIAFLSLVLLIPLLLVGELIHEREQRQHEVIREINSKWGNEITFYGPILKVPYRTYNEKTIYSDVTKSKEVVREAVINYGYFFPNDLNITCDVNSREKKRNNYKSVVFTSTMKGSGNFIKPDFSSKRIADEDIMWNEATIILKSTNLKGIKSDVKIKLNNELYPLEATYSDNETKYMGTLESTFLNDRLTFKEKPVSFSFSITYNGSEGIKFIPIGKVTDVTMKSNWVDPSFVGNYLPQNDGEKVTASGFNAIWKVLQVNRSFPQQSFNTIPNLMGYAFGTDFIFPVDEYQKSERTTKYGFLIIGLTFLCFFLIQTLSKIHIHAFQYLMIGIALVMFYTLLISISEHSSFTKAYIISSIAVISLISLYATSILKNIKFPILIGISLTALYSFIFVIVHLENYALLVGSIGLFLILAMVMYVSRKIEWHND